MSHIRLPISSFVMPKQVLCRSGAISALSALPATRVAIISTKRMSNNFAIEKLKDNPKRRFVLEIIPPSWSGEPILADMAESLKAIEEFQPDYIVAIGGGRIIDGAKLLWAFYEHPNLLIERLEVAFAIPKLRKKSLFCAIPTTAGTGSEVTHHSVIIDTRTNNLEKISCRGEGFVPMVSIIDYELTLSKPKRLTIDSAIDTLTHGIEAYVSKKATLFSDRMALDTIRLVTENIYAVDKNPKDIKAREGLMLAATLGGLAFSNASICLVHGMSRPLGSNFKVPHGLSNAMLLPTITEFSLGHAKSRYAECSRAGKFSSVDDDDDTACKKLLSGLYKINKDFEVPSMKKFGIDKKNFEEQLENMATDAEISGAPNLNPRVPSVKEMIDLYGEAWRAF
mgnify:CR=1 FL=1